MGFANFKELSQTDAYAGQLSSWRKLPSQITTIGIWFDLSMSPGNPSPQYYASSPLEAKVMSRLSAGGGLNHGHTTAPEQKHLRKIMGLATVATGLPMPMSLCDYLMFYPFVDESLSDLQEMNNVVTLPRYTTGQGVQIMAVSVAGRVGGQTFQVTYTNSSGVAGRVTEVVVENSVSVTGSIVSSDRANANARGPFLPLQAGDTGVRSIQSVQMVSGVDVGLFTLVLVKPLAQMQIRGIDAPVEVDYMQHFAQAPVIEDDAYLNFLACPAGSLAATTIMGTIEVAWN